jgi:hypothetical protein
MQLNKSKELKTELEMILAGEGRCIKHAIVPFPSLDLL